jgi:SAM-dependent methyltransferase
MSDPADVARQYATASLLDRIDAALAHAGLDAARLDWRDLAPLDHFHSRGFAATLDLAQALAPAPETHVLDVGCGVGGPARLLAATYGCRVTGVDLTPAAVAAATVLSARTGLGASTRFVVADALALPFPDASFDHAWTQHAAMIIGDRARLYAEVRRVLRPGGRLAIHDVVTGDGDALLFPVPWAATPQSSFLLTPEEMRAVLVAAGFDILSWEDKTAVTLAGPPAPVGDAGMAPSPLGSFVLAGPEYPRMVETFLRNLREGRAGVVQVIAVRC